MQGDRLASVSLGVFLACVVILCFISFYEGSEAFEYHLAVGGSSCRSSL